MAGESGADGSGVDGVNVEGAAEGSAGGWPRRFEDVGAREARVVARARAAAPADWALADELLAVYYDLLGAVEEDDRLVWPGDEPRLAFESGLVRLYDDLLASLYLVQRGLYLQACRLWLDYLETLWLALHAVRQPAAASGWLRGETVEPLVARGVLEAAGQLGPLGAELYAQLDRQSHPRAKQGFERALTVRQQWGEWRLQYVLAGEGNAAWLRRGVGDWLFVAALGLAEIAALGVVPPASGWSARRMAAVAAVQARLGVEFT